MGENTNVLMKIENVNKSYKLTNKEEFQALYDINVEFHKGELVSIVGESGSGKSTLMNLIGGLDSDYTGKILVDGENIRDYSEKQLDKYRKDKIGFVFQSFNLISHLSVLDNVTMALTLSNVSEKEKVEKATKLLEMVGLKSQIKKKPTQLSGGQKQRVAIARALINDPEILVADEPTGALDTTTTMQLLKILKNIADSGTLVIMVTHSEKVASISSRVVEISDGRIISDRKNEDYKKDEDLNQIAVSKDKKTRKQNLSFWSAVRLSLHNMWSSKTKNILMAIGVGIGIGSLLIMLCFSYGITGYITSLMNSYSDPTVVTISKSSENSNSMISSFVYDQFTEDEVSSILSEINTYLAESGESLTLSEGTNVYRGFSALTLGALGSSSGGTSLSATIWYDKNGDGNMDSDEYMSAYYLYTTPPYYTDTNLSEGQLSSSNGGIMINSALSKLFNETSNDEGISLNTEYEISGVGEKVTVIITYTTSDGTTQTESMVVSQDTNTYTFADEEITGIIDSSVMSSMPLLYVDYDYLEYLFDSVGLTLEPTTLYLDCETEELANLVSAYVSENIEGVTGAIEETLSSMFTSMLSIIGSSLIIISMISLIVSAIMILVVMYMSVTERTREIGVLKSIGARKQDIRSIFSSESLLVGILSGIVGLIVVGILYLIISLALMGTVGFAPLTFKWWFVLIAFGVSIVISLLSGIIPANKAAKLDPVESLRHE